MRKVLGLARLVGLALLVGALLGAAVGLLAARLSRVKTFILVSDKPPQPVEFGRSVQSMLPTAVLGGVLVALVIVAVSLRVGVRLVHDSTRPRRLLLRAVSVVAGAVLGAATVFFVHYASWTASLRTHQFGPDTGVVHRPNWFPSLAIAIGIGAVVGAAAAGVMQSAGVRLVSSREPRAQLRATTR